MLNATDWVGETLHSPTRKVRGVMVLREISADPTETDDKGRYRRPT